MLTSGRSGSRLSMSSNGDSEKKKDGRGRTGITRLAGVFENNKLFLLSIQQRRKTLYHALEECQVRGLKGADGSRLCKLFLCYRNL